MTTGGIVTNVGKNLVLSRLYGSGDTAITQFKIGTGTNTPIVGDTDLQTPILTKNFVPGYPTFDTVNFKVTTRGFISSAEANGNLITETGEFNTDGTPKMSTRFVFTGISKTVSDEIAIVIINRMI
jgi:hypothetical protein